MVIFLSILTVMVITPFFLGCCSGKRKTTSPEKKKTVEKPATIKVEKPAKTKVEEPAKTKVEKPAKTKVEKPAKAKLEKKRKPSMKPPSELKPSKIGPPSAVANLESKSIIIKESVSSSKSTSSESSERSSIDYDASPKIVSLMGSIKKPKQKQPSKKKIRRRVYGDSERSDGGDEDSTYQTSLMRQPEEQESPATNDELTQKSERSIVKSAKDRSISERKKISPLESHYADVAEKTAYGLLDDDKNSKQLSIVKTISEKDAEDGGAIKEDDERTVSEMLADTDEDEQTVREIIFDVNDQDVSQLTNDEVSEHASQTSEEEENSEVAKDLGEEE